MGADWTAYTVIGCEVTGKLHRDVVKPGCEHVAALAAIRTVPPPFCPQCGKKSVRLESVPIDGYDDNNHFVGVVGLATLPVTFSTDDERAFVGVRVIATENQGVAYAPPIINLSIIRDVLEPLGLWDAASFSIWTVLHCSY